MQLEFTLDLRASTIWIIFPIPIKPFQTLNIIPTLVTRPPSPLTGRQCCPKTPRSQSSSPMNTCLALDVAWGLLIGLSRGRVIFGSYDFTMEFDVWLQFIFIDHAFQRLLCGPFFN